jgi:hypothetical protein
VRPDGWTRSLPPPIQPARAAGDEA